MVSIGTEPARHVHWLTWGIDLQASPVLEPVQLGPEPAPSSSAWWSRDGQVRTCGHVPRGNRLRDRLSRCARAGGGVIEVNRSGAWRVGLALVGTDTHGQAGRALYKPLRRGSQGTDESNRQLRRIVACGRPLTGGCIVDQ